MSLYREFVLRVCIASLYCEFVWFNELILLKFNAPFPRFAVCYVPGFITT